MIITQLQSMFLRSVCLTQTWAAKRLRAGLLPYTLSLNCHTT